MMLTKLRAPLAGGALMLAATPAAAQVTLETGEAEPQSTYKAVLRVGHGCEGHATTAVRVRIPDGMIMVKPMPKPGWEIEIKKGTYERPYDYFGETLTEGVTEIAWSGGELPDAYYEEFVFRGRLTGFEPGTVLSFPVVQECTEGVHRWIEIPAEGQDPDELDEPAPQLTITKGSAKAP
jgi:periplasmic copper chaperone A